MKKIFYLSFLVFILLFSYEVKAQSVGIGDYELMSNEKLDYLKPLVQEALQAAFIEAGIKQVKTVSVSEKEIQKAGYRKVLQTQKVEALLTGSLLKAGAPIQINSRLFIGGQTAPKTFSDQAENADQLLPVLKKHAAKISESLKKDYAVIGSNTSAAAVVLPNPALPPLTQIVSKKKTATVLMSPLTRKPPVTETAKAQNSNFIEFPDYKWMSERLNFEARGIAVANFQGDPNPALVFIDLNHVYVYAFANQTLKLLAKYDAKNSDQFVRVYAQDLDGDGRAEILISNVSYGQASSLILKYKANGEFQVLADKIPWLLKSITYQGGPLLLGEVFYGKEQARHKLKKLKFQDGKIQEDGDWNIPGDLGLYGVQGVSGEKQNPDLIYLTPSGTLKTYSSQSGHFEKNWSSSESYGGSANYIQQPVKNVLNQEEENNTFFNLDPIAWTNRAGELEVLVAKNDTFLKNIVGTRPIFKNSWLVKLKNSSMGLREQWNSKKVDGAILDLIPYSAEKGPRQILALFWLRDRGFAASFKRYPSVLAVYDVETSP
ncbi:MAG: VCBS repeat-containing protein [Deltaproteobacteria bacterium]|nr:VCBS repeat-containing protein [Deltaproteobacteria bacterium]